MLVVATLNIKNHLLALGFIVAFSYKVNLVTFRPLNKHDINYSKVIDLFFEAFPKVQRLPEWLVKYRMRNGKNGFSPTGFIIKEPAERQEVLIRGGTISKQEIEAMYKHFLGNILFSVLKIEVLKIE